jgi:hypothetical protein
MFEGRFGVSQSQMGAEYGLRNEQHFAGFFHQNKIVPANREN